MDTGLSSRILKAWKIDGLSLEEQVIKIFERVRDIPFGRMGSRDPKDVYERNKGTCSGKNFLLKALYASIGLETKDMICLQRWKDLTWFPDDIYGVVQLPGELMDILMTHEIVDFHNYVAIRRQSGWVRVDATIDLPLTAVGFFTTEQWDGKSDMPLCFVGTDKVWDCGDKGAQKKSELTAMLPQSIQDARNHFLERMTDWIDTLREGNQI